MVWNDVRIANPQQWVIIEALDALTEGNKRIINEMTVVDTFQNDSKEALKKYVQLHKAFPNRELYVVHTSRPELDIEELLWTGVRTAR